MSGEAYALSIIGGENEVPEWLCRPGFARLVLITDPQYTFIDEPVARLLPEVPIRKP